MNSNILISATQLSDLIQAGKCTVVDCRFDFSDALRGRADWISGHIPGAAYADLDRDLAAPVDDHTGRHPLPDADKFARFLASTGWSSGKLLVAYDGGSNAISSRLWWLMRYFGQPSALLDGGLAAWTAAGYPLEAGAPQQKPAQLERLLPHQNMIVNSADILENLCSPGLTVLDARAVERFTGEVENLDTKAGHIPGALNRPFGSNLDSKGCFRSPIELRAQFDSLLGGEDFGHVVHSCGSGVTACHNLFAMELAGMHSTHLYPGSWSEWIRDDDRPVETGN